MVSLLLALSCLGGAIAAGQGSLSKVSDSDWAQLNKTLGGKLHVGRPYNGPCYKKYEDGTSAYDAAECQTIDKTLTQAQVLVQDFGSYVNPSFGSCLATGKKCTLSPDADETFPKGTCYQGAVPPKFVDASSASDVETALKFASKNNLPITVKNTGHDYRGRSSGVDTFAIWTHHITPDLKLERGFTPAGCSDAQTSPVITYGAGHKFAELYDFLSKDGLIMVGGTCPTVGAAGGYLAGGGYGILTPDHGLAVDNALQIRAVLLNGTHVTASRCQNQDLFFALRGGGGGTYAVVTEVTSMTLPDDKAIAAVSLAVVVPEPRKITEIFVKNTARWFDDGWTGSIGVGPGNVATFIGLTSKLNLDQAKASIKVVDDYFQSVSSAKNPYKPVYTTNKNYYDYQVGPISAAFAQRGIGNTTIISSRLVPKDHFADAASQKALVDVLISNPYGAALTPPVRYQQPASDLAGGPGMAAVSPAWRTAYWHVVHEALWDPADVTASSAETTAKTFKALSDSMNSLRDLTPTGGAYMNEGDTYEPDPEKTFWGTENYKRLQKIKKQLDPDNLLSCHGCIGAVDSDKRNSCFPKI